MTIGTGDISFVFSGGAVNQNPNLSLGGEPSNYVIPGTVLFPDIDPNQARVGVRQYRCFYLSNDSDTETLYNASVRVSSQIVGGASVELGFISADARQIVQISATGTITGGSITFRYNSLTPTDFTVNAPGAGESWQENFLAAIRTVPHLEQVDVSVSVVPVYEILNITIYFINSAGGRNHPTLLVMSNDLILATGTSQIQVVPTIIGGPINLEADSIDADTTAPTGVIFDSASKDLGNLYPYDVVPIWVRRITAPGTQAIENDGFTFRVSGTALPE